MMRLVLLGHPARQGHPGPAPARRPRHPAGLLRRPAARCRRARHGTRQARQGRDGRGRTGVRRDRARPDPRAARSPGRAKASSSTAIRATSRRPARSTGCSPTSASRSSGHADGRRPQRARPAPDRPAHLPDLRQGVQRLFVAVRRQGEGCDNRSGDAPLLIQRADDKEDVIANRLKVYEGQTQPLIEHYRRAACCRVVNADQTVEQVTPSSCAPPK